MRDLAANRMAELKFEAPLALQDEDEETDEWGPVDFQSSNATLKAAICDSLNLNLKENDNNILNLDDLITAGGGIDTNNLTEKSSPNCNSTPHSINKNNIDNFTETISGSLEDLVNTFDEKITKCFGNYEESVEEIAPVQIRSQEEIINECQ